MPDEATSPRGLPDFPHRVWALVRRIPRGRVTTYGHLARALGSPRAARQVGWSLHATPPDGDVPAHRVVNRYGELSGGWHFGHPDVMKRLLLAEDVPFSDDYRVDLARALWIPWEDLDGAAPDEVDYLDLVAGFEAGRGERVAIDDDAIALDDDEAVE